MPDYLRKILEAEYAVLTLLDADGAVRRYAVRSLDGAVDDIVMGASARVIENPDSPGCDVYEELWRQLDEEEDGDGE